MSGWCTVTQLDLGFNATELDDYADDNADGTADTGVQQGAIDRAANWIWGIIQPRYQAVTAMVPGTYTAGSGAYPVLENWNIILGRDCLAERQGGAKVTQDHPILREAWRVAQGIGSVGV